MAEKWPQLGGQAGWEGSAQCPQHAGAASYSDDTGLLRASGDDGGGAEEERSGAATAPGCRAGEGAARDVVLPAPCTLFPPLAPALLVCRMGAHFPGQGELRAPLCCTHKASLSSLGRVRVSLGAWEKKHMRFGETIPTSCFAVGCRRLRAHWQHSPGTACLLQPAKGRGACSWHGGKTCLTAAC